MYPLIATASLSLRIRSATLGLDKPIESASFRTVMRPFGLVAILLRELDAAMKLAARHITTHEDNEARFKLLLIGDKSRCYGPLCRICANLQRSGAEIHNCADAAKGFASYFIMLFQLSTVVLSSQPHYLLLGIGSRDLS